MHKFFRHSLSNLQIFKLKLAVLCPLTTDPLIGIWCLNFLVLEFFLSSAHRPLINCEQNLKLSFNNNFIMFIEHLKPNEVLYLPPETENSSLNK